VPRRQRLDAELVRRGLARSREHAGDLIAQGRVSVGGTAATKAATGVSTDVALVVTADPARPEYVSRGGHKLAGALQRFGPDGLQTHGRRALDAGASTGGFTDVLLRAGVAHVERGAVALRVDRNRRRPHLAARTDDAHGDLAAIGDQNLLHLGC